MPRMRSPIFAAARSCDGRKFTVEVKIGARSLRDNRTHARKFRRTVAASSPAFPACPLRLRSTTGTERGRPRSQKSFCGQQWVGRIDHTVLHLPAQIIREIVGKRGNGVGRTQRVDHPDESRCVAILTHGDALQRQTVGMQRDPHQVTSELCEHRNQVARWSTTKIGVSIR